MLHQAPLFWHYMIKIKTISKIRTNSEDRLCLLTLPVEVALIVGWFWLLPADAYAGLSGAYNFKQNTPDFPIEGKQFRDFEKGRAHFQQSIVLRDSQIQQMVFVVWKERIQTKQKWSDKCMKSLACFRVSDVFVFFFYCINSDLMQWVKIRELVNDRRESREKWSGGIAWEV